MSTADSPVPSTSAGMIMRARLPVRLSPIGTKPEAGSQPKRTDTSRMSMMPSQKFGTDTPHSDMPLASTSQTPLRCTAASTPAGMAMASATTSDRHASSSVMGSLEATIHATEVRVRIDSPRSPTAARRSQRTYCTGSGASSPYFCRISSRPAASASAPAITRAGSPGIMRTPVKTIRLMSSSVIAEMTPRRIRNSSTRRRLLPGRPLDADEPVGHGLVALEALRERHEVVGVIEEDRVPSRADDVDGLPVGRGALGHVRDLARLVQQRVELLVAGQRGVEAASAGLALVDVAVGIDAAAPADEERLVLAVVVVLEGRGELRGPQADVEASLAGHALDDLAHAALLWIVDDDHLELVAVRQPGVGQELLGAGDVARGALARLVEEHAVGRDRPAPHGVLAVVGHLVERLAIDRQLQRLAHPRVVGQRRAQIAGRVLLAGLVVDVDRDRVEAETGHAG